MKVFEKGVEVFTAYAASGLLLLQEVNWAVVGGLILFIARAVVDIPKAIDYWERRIHRWKRKRKKHGRKR